MSLCDAVVVGQYVFRIRNWQQMVGRGRSTPANGRLGRLSSILLGPVSGLKTLARRRLLRLPHGVAAYGVWILLAAIAAETSIPGTFLDDGSPLTLEDLSLLTDVPLEELRQAIEVLSRPEVRLIEQVSLEEALSVPEDDSAKAVPATQPATQQPHACETACSPLQPTMVPACDSISDVSASDLAQLEAFVRRGFAQDDVERKEDDAKAGYAIPARASELASQPKVERADWREIEKTEEQVARLRGMVQQVDQMQRQAAAMSNGTPLLTASRKGRPNGWKVNAKLNSSKKS